MGRISFTVVRLGGAALIWADGPLGGSISAKLDQALNQLDDTKLGEGVTITFGGNSRIVARGGMVLGHALDLADHYSQLANYMRLNNLIPPTALPRG